MAVDYSVPSWIHGANPLQALTAGSELGLRIAEANNRSAIAWAELQRRQQEFQQEVSMQQQRLEAQKVAQQQQFAAEQQMHQERQLYDEQKLQVENAYRQGQLDLQQQKLNLTANAAAEKANASGRFLQSLNTLTSGYMAEEGMSEEQARAKAVPQALYDSGMFQYVNPTALAGMLKATQARGAGEFIDIPGGGKGYISPQGALTITERNRQTPEPRFSVTPPSPEDPQSQAKVSRITGVTPEQLRQFGVTNVGKYVAPEVNKPAAAPPEVKRYRYNPKSGKIEAITQPASDQEEDNAIGDSGN